MIDWKGILKSSGDTCQTAGVVKILLCVFVKNAADNLSFTPTPPFPLKVVLASIWLLGVIIAAVPLMNEGVFGNYYGHNGVCFPLHSDRQEKPTAKGYSTGVFLGKFKTKIPQQLVL